MRALHEARLAVGVVSNTGWDIRVAFSHRDLERYVDVFVLSYEVGCTKPDPAIFELAAERLDVAVSELLMVGDDPRADSGAVSAGLPTVLLPAAAPGGDNSLGLVSALVGAAPR
jgi:HAD superfamily hydrolase (TIGR01509 family)